MAESQATTADMQTAVGTMGMTGTINITSQMMKDAITAITNYREAVKSAYASLVKEMGTVPTNFTGAAANGFNKFYTESIEPMLKENGSLEAMLNSLEDICKSALAQLPGEEGIDESLAKVNHQNAGGTDGAGTAGTADGAGA